MNGIVCHTPAGKGFRHQVIAGDLRVEQTSLDDAFVALTGRTIDN